MTVSITEQVACVKREIAFRRRVYPRFVQQQKMTQQAADYQITCMESVLENLERLERAGQLDLMPRDQHG